MAARKDAERLATKRDLVLASVLALPVFILEMGSHLVPATHHWVMDTTGKEPSWHLQFVLTTIILLVPGRRFCTKGVPALVRLAPDINSLVAVGTRAACAYSFVTTFMPRVLPIGTVNVYFEAEAVFVSLILLGRRLGDQAKSRASHAIGRAINRALRSNW